MPFARLIIIEPALTALSAIRLSGGGDWCAQHESLTIRGECGNACARSVYVTRSLAAMSADESAHMRAHECGFGHSRSGIHTPLSADEPMNGPVTNCREDNTLPNMGTNWVRLRRQLAHGILYLLSRLVCSEAALP